MSRNGWAWRRSEEKNETLMTFLEVDRSNPLVRLFPAGATSTGPLAQLLGASSKSGPDDTTSLSRSAPRKPHLPLCCNYDHHDYHAIKYMRPEEDQAPARMTVSSSRAIKSSVAI